MALGLPDDPAQQQRLLIGIVPLLALFAYWYFLHDARYRPELETMETRLEQLETRNSQARMRAPQSRQLEERLTEFERHIERLEQLVPRDEEVSQLLNTISERADQIGVSIRQFTPGGSEAGTHYNRRTFQMGVRGTYHEVGHFLSEIGSLPRIITPTELHLVPFGEDDGDGVELEASFVIETYVLPEPDQARTNQGAAGA